MTTTTESSPHTLYLSPDANKILVVQVNEDGNGVNVLQQVEPVVESFAGMKEGTPFGIATEWIVRHPRHDILFALTSAWNQHEAVLTTFRILEDGKLEKLSACDTGGCQACHAVFSNNGNTLAVAHYNDGKLSFFDTTKVDESPLKPALVMDSPLFAGYERQPTQGSAMSTLLGGCPSIHGVAYSPKGNLFLTCDPHQGGVSSFTVDENGMPSSEEPICMMKCKEPDVPLQTLAKWIGFTSRPRRVVFHPDGKHIVVLHEVKNVLQVYAISEDGKIDSTSLQEISVLEREPKGVALGAAAELESTAKGLLVSNREVLPFSSWFGSAESSVARFVWEKQGQSGAFLKKVESIPTSGPVRHFFRQAQDQRKVFVATAHSKTHVLATLEMSPDGELRQTGDVKLPASVFCIA